MILNDSQKWQIMHLKWADNSDSTTMICMGQRSSINRVEKESN